MKLSETLVHIKIKEYITILTLQVGAITKSSKDIYLIKSLFYIC